MGFLEEAGLVLSADLHGGGQKGDRQSTTGNGAEVRGPVCRERR